MLIWLALLLTLACSKSDAPNPTLYPVEPGKIDEASGIADSRKNPGYLWVEQDSDNPTDLALLSHTGSVLKKIFISSVRNRDWEDIALAAGPDPAKNYLYIADIGDNALSYGTYFIYRIEEPAKSVDTVKVADTIAFRYPDGSHDAEAILIDPDTRDIYVITKRETQSNIYRLSYPYQLHEINSVSFVAKLPYNGVVSAAIQPDGKGIAVKTYLAINYYARSVGEPVGDCLQKTYKPLPYQPEQQGEAITFALSGSGYFTLSERRLGTVSLNYYKK